MKKILAAVCLGAALIAIALLVPTHLRVGHAMQSKVTPIASSGLPSPMMYDSGDPITLAYPCDASHTGLPFYNLSSGVARPLWICNGTTWIQAQAAISGATTSIGGALLIAGGSVTGTATVAGATTGNNCLATPSDGSFLPVGLNIDCRVSGSGANNVTVRISAALAGTPPALTYNIRVLQ